VVVLAITEKSVSGIKGNVDVNIYNGDAAIKIYHR
jgi:hypothetical protein